MKNRLRPLFALSLLLPLILILTLQTTATPRAEDDQGIEQRRDRERDEDEDNERQRRDRDDEEDERRRDRERDDDNEDDERRRADRDEVDDDRNEAERINYYRKAEAELKELVEAGKISRRQAQERLVGLRKKLWSHDDDERRRDRDDDDDDEEDRRWLNPRTEEKILDALDDETVMEFADVPLKDMVDQLADRHKIPVWIDEQSLDEIGMGTDTAVNQNLRGISLRSGLNLTLGSLRLTYVIQDEVLKITTPEQADADLTSRIYPLGDLILPRDEHEASFATRIGAAVAAGRISREEAGKIFERHDRQEKHPQRNLHGDEQDREEHLQAAIEHLQGAGVSARTARHVIAEAMRLKDKDDDHHEVERRHDEDADDDEERRHDEDEDEDKFHYHAHHETATQLEALRREVEELRQLIKRMAARR
ncbi:MAG: hypothetical protein VB857_12790 [Pirellulaceae bacterium]